MERNVLIDDDVTITEPGWPGFTARVLGIERRMDMTPVALIVSTPNATDVPSIRVALDRACVSSLLWEEEEQMMVGI